MEFGIDKKELTPTLIAANTIYYCVFIKCNYSLDFYLYSNYLPVTTVRLTITGLH